jgi:hypothetical protein
MARWRRAVELAMTGEEIERLTAGRSVRRSGLTQPKMRHSPHCKMAWRAGGPYALSNYERLTRAAHPLSQYGADIYHLNGGQDG